MLPLKCRLPITSARLLVSTNMIRQNEQKCYASLNMQTLNPLVKEVEYAVRGKYICIRKKSDLFFINL